MKYWLTCTRFTVQVNTNDTGIIVWAAPITRGFIGQPLGNLFAWMRGFGGFYSVLLPVNYE
jgi:hypothetical protein